MGRVSVGRKRGCEIVSLLKKYVVKKSSPSEKVTAIQGNTFWTCSHSKKVALHKKVGNAEYCFCEKLEFSKI